MTTLASWNDGPVMAAVVDFVSRVTRAGDSDFVPPSDRIATFDNDGTLWCEQPMPVQGFFLADRVKALAAADPSISERQPFKAFLERDHVALHALGKQGLMELFAATHAHMTDEEFEAVAQAWFASAKHPKLGCAYTQVVFRPQIELLNYLRANGFSTYIVSGGGVDFIRAVSESVYGVPRAQVVGSSVKTAFQFRDGVGVLQKQGELGSFDDREAKPANIGLHIGRRPILAFGNSDGDLAMLRYVKTGAGPRLALLLHHDDAEREFAYDRDFKVSPLADALDNAQTYGITVVSMKRDWATVFPKV